MMIGRVRSADRPALRPGRHWGKDRAGAGARSRSRFEARLAQGLGIFGLGLGAAQTLAPRRFAQAIGVPDRGPGPLIVRAVGVREIGAGAVLLARPRSTVLLWARVAGDLMDLALLGSALRSRRSRRPRVLAAAVGVAGVLVPDLIDAVRLSRPDPATSGEHDGPGIGVKKAITIGRPAEEVYRFWRDFENLPRFMAYLESVEVLTETRSHWKARGPAGKTVEWDAEIVEDRQSEVIAWRSLTGADVANSGRVRFRPAPGGRGTEIDVELTYDAPGGRLGRAIAQLLGKEPGQLIGGDLRRLKQVLETGEVIRSEATYQGNGLPQRPARPPEDGEYLRPHGKPHGGMNETMTTA